MIRTILAVALTVALVATAAPVVRQGAGVAADEAVRSEVATLEAAATALVETEEVPPKGVAGPRRVLALSLPRGTAATESLESLAIERAGERSVVTYRLGDGSASTIRLDVPVVAPDGGPVGIDGGGEIRFALELRSDEGRPVVVATPGV